MQFRHFLAFCLIFVSMGLFAQTGSRSTAQEIETLLGSSAISYAQAARFVLEAADALSTNNQQEAFNYASQRKWLPKNAAPGQAARLDGISLLCMNSFGIKGGLFYSLAKNPHYAYRELSYKKIIQGRVDPAMNVSGNQLLFMISRILGEQDKAAGVQPSARRTARQAAARREALAAEISAILEEHDVADASAQATDQGVTITLSNIQFLAESTTLAATERSKLNEIANILRNLTNIKVEVAGHTALAGSEEGRLALSQGRAQSVANYLVSQRAIAAENITAVGYGADRPVADNNTPEGMAANRRVEITIIE